MQTGQKPDGFRVAAQRLIGLVQRHKGMQAGGFEYDVFNTNGGVNLLVIQIGEQILLLDRWINTDTFGMKGQRCGT